MHATGLVCTQHEEIGPFHIAAVVSDSNIVVYRWNQPEGSLWDTSAVGEEYDRTLTRPSIAKENLCGNERFWKPGELPGIQLERPKPTIDVLADCQRKAES